MRRVAVLGVGGMGSRIAGRLALSGHEVSVWSRSGRIAAEIDGLLWAQSPAEAAARAELIITMVSDGPALRAVTNGSEGMLAGLPDDCVVCQMSTVDLETTAWLAGELPGRLLDTPVLGSVAEAASGTLTLFVGGPDALVDRCVPVLERLGSIRRIGDVGAGTAAKLVANGALFGVLGVLGESLVLAERCGLSRDVAFEVLATTPQPFQTHQAVARSGASLHTGHAQG